MLYCLVVIDSIWVKSYNMQNSPDDLIGNTLKVSLGKKRQQLDQNVASAAQRVLQQNIQFVPSKKICSFQLSSLKSKYVLLRPSREASEMQNTADIAVLPGAELDGHDADKQADGKICDTMLSTKPTEQSVTEVPLKKKRKKNKCTSEQLLFTFDMEEQPSSKKKRDDSETRKTPEQTQSRGTETVDKKRKEKGKKKVEDQFQQESSTSDAKHSDADAVHIQQQATDMQEEEEEGLQQHSFAPAASVPVVEWDQYVDCLGKRKKKPKTSSPAPTMAWDGRKTSSVIEELSKRPTVSTWGGERSQADIEAEREEKRRQKKSWRQQYDEEIDRGRVKKKKKKVEDCPWPFNPFQKVQNERNQQKHRWSDYLT